MERKIPPPLSLALAILRTRQGWAQKELAAAAGIPANLLSDYERGRKTLTRERLDFLLTLMGLQPSRALRAAMRFLEDEEIREPDPPSPESRDIEGVAAESGRLISDATRSLMTLLTSRGQALEARRQARDLWEGLKRKDAAKRRLLVEKVAKYQNWALSELLCEESIKAAGDSADRALDLANLALRVAELAPGEEAWRQRVQGYAWAHVGNARRVKGDLPSADEAFGRSQRLWSAGAWADAGVLNEARVLGLEASLRRVQTRFAEARDLLDRALAVDQGDEAKFLLLNKAKLLEEIDDFVGAIAALQRAAPIVESEGGTRFLLLLRHNLALCLCALERYGEVEALLPGIETLAAKVGNDLDKLRLHWLKGRLWAGLGWRDKAAQAFFSVRDGLISRKIPYDAALVSLELAAVYLEAGRLEEVKNLARQMASVFRLQGIHREALAALMIFRDAAERKTVTLELARRLIRYLRHAEGNPGLKFEAR
ncbi:MAG TPA: helix-turn-helix transcriptional regulator [Thermoanaerobaculia bacterium]